MRVFHGESREDGRTCRAWGEGNVIDHFSEKPLQKYLDHFDQAFKGYDVSGLRYYFNDSYEVDDAFGEADWTPMMFEEFAEFNGYDLRAHLPALLGRDTPEQNARVIYDYRMTVSRLLAERYTRIWQAWASGQGRESATKHMVLLERVGSVWNQRCSRNRRDSD